MTVRQSNWLKVGLTVLPLLTGAWVALNAHFVQRAEYDKHITIDSVDRAKHVALDSVERSQIHTEVRELHTEIHEVLTRVQQIQCGTRIQQGCR